MVLMAFLTTASGQTLHFLAVLWTHSVPKVPLSPKAEKKDNLRKSVFNSASLLHASLFVSRTYMQSPSASSALYDVRIATSPLLLVVSVSSVGFTFISLIYLLNFLLLFNVVQFKYLDHHGILLCDNSSSISDEDKYSLITPDSLLQGWPWPSQFELVIQCHTCGLWGGREHGVQHLHQGRNCLRGIFYVAKI